VIQSSPMNATATDLPDDAETLKAMILALRTENETLRAVNADAEARMARLIALERARYGRRSKTFDPDQHAFAFEEIETGLAGIGASLEAAKPAPTERAPRQRQALTAHLPRIEVVIEPDATAVCCGSCDRVKLGEDVSERLDWWPAKFRVIVHPAVRLPCMQTPAARGASQAQGPAWIIDAGLPTEALLAQVAVSKYADGHLVWLTNSPQTR
jgi:transposase